MSLRYAVLAAFVLVAVGKSTRSAGKDSDEEGIFGPPQNVKVDCKNPKSKYTAVVTWDENEDAALQAGGYFTYHVEYRSNLRSEWTEHPVNGYGRAFLKLAPGARYEFRVVGYSPRGASRPSAVTTQECAF